MRVLARRQSMDDLRSASSPDELAMTTRQGYQRQKSLSLDDLESVKESQQGVTFIEAEEQQTPGIRDIYTYPKLPVQEPPHRPSTPPGLPSWTEHQLRPRKLPRHRISAGLRQLFGFRSSQIELQNDELGTSHGHRLGRSSISVPVPRIARFRPPKSAYGGIKQHPFNNAPPAAVDPFLRLPVSPRPTEKHKSVRFTPSTAAQESDSISPRPGTEQVHDAESQLSTAHIDLVPPVNSLQPRSSSSSKPQRCPHHKAKLKQLSHSNSTILGIDYQAILAHPLTCDQSRTSLPRISTPSPIQPSPARCPGSCEPNWDMGIIDAETINGAPSNSSTTHLMSGARIAPSHSPTPGFHHDTDRGLASSSGNYKSCWKCRLESLTGKFQELRKRSANCLWLVCCGFDVNNNEDENTYAPRNVRVELEEHMTARDHWWGSGDSPLGPVRRLTFDGLQPWAL